MGNRSLFPGRVSEANQGRGQPRRGYHRPKPATHSGAGRKSRRAACFLWYFLSRRKKVLPPRGGSPSVRAGVGASIPRQEKGFAPAGAPKGFPRGKQSARFALPCAPLVVCLNDRSLTAFGGCIHWIPASLRSPLETFGPRRLAGFPLGATSPTTRAVVGASDPAGRRPAPAGAPKGFPRGKQSARFALPCAPLVVCLNDRSLTAFGGCIHWIPASLRSPLETFGPRRWAKLPHRITAAMLPRRSRRGRPFLPIPCFFRFSSSTPASPCPAR